MVTNPMRLTFATGAYRPWKAPEPRLAQAGMGPDRIQFGHAKPFINRLTVLGLMGGSYFLLNRMSPPPHPSTALNPGDPPPSHQIPGDSGKTYQVEPLDFTVIPPAPEPPPPSAGSGPAFKKSFELCGVLVPTNEVEKLLPPPSVCDNPNHPIFMQWAVDSAIEHRLDPGVYVNLLYAENKYRELGCSKDKHGNPIACGIAMFTKSTWERHCTPDASQRFDPKVAIPCGARYLAKNRHGTFASEPDMRVAVAGYNAGAQNARKGIDKFRETCSYQFRLGLAYH